MGFSRQEYWSGLPFPSPGGLSDPGIETVSPALQADSLPLSNQVSPYCTQAQRIIKQVPLLLPVRPRNRTLLHQRCSAHPSFINTLSRTHPAPHIASSCHVRFFQSVAVPYLSQPWIFPLAMPHGMWDLPRSGIKPAPPAAQVWSFVNHWTTKEVHSLDSFKAYRPLTL